MHTIDLHARRDLMRLYFDGERIQHGMPAVPPESSPESTEALAKLADTGRLRVALSQQIRDEHFRDSLETTDSEV
jgi:hypothetical protein